MARDEKAAAAGEGAGCCHTENALARRNLSGQTGNYTLEPEALAGSHPRGGRGTTSLVMCMSEPAPGPPRTSPGL